MYRPKTEKDIRCPLEYGLSVFGGKWKTRILCLLASESPRRYSALAKDLCNVTDAVLSASLRELVADGMISRVQYAEIPPRVEYELTEKGKSVLPILRSIGEWAGAFYRSQESGSPQCKQCDYREKE